MAKRRKHIKTSSLGDFKKYLSGEMSPSERHVFEKRAMDDDFENEALEGMEKFEAKEVEADLANLHERISKVSGRISYPRIAAVIALFVSVTVALFFLLGPENSSRLTNKRSPSAEEKPAVVESQPAGRSARKKTDSLLLSQEHIAAIESSIETTQQKKPVASGVQENSERLNPEVAEDAFLTDLEITKSETTRVNNTLVLQNIKPVEVNELQPIPETGNFNRIASAKVKSSEDRFLNEQKAGLPSQLKYPEGINDIPDGSGKESLSLTIAGKTYSKTSNAETEISAPPLVSKKQKQVEYVQTSEVSNPVPHEGYERYYDFLYAQIQSLEIAAERLPGVIEINLILSNTGEIEEIQFLTLVDEYLEEELRRILHGGPEWIVPDEASKKKRYTVVLRLEFDN